MWDLIVSVPDHCLSFYFVDLEKRVYLLLPLLNCQTNLGRLETFYIKPESSSTRLYPEFLGQLRNLPLNRNAGSCTLRSKDWLHANSPHLKLATYQSHPPEVTKIF